MKRRSYRLILVIAALRQHKALSLSLSKSSLTTFSQAHQEQAHARKHSVTFLFQQNKSQGQGEDATRASSLMLETECVHQERVPVAEHTHTHTHTHAQNNKHAPKRHGRAWTRRNVISKSLAFGTIASASASLPNCAHAREKSVDVLGGGRLFEIHDPQTYSGLVYLPNKLMAEKRDGESNGNSKKYPVLFVLHGAGKNELDVWNLADIQGEHSGLVPSLLKAGKAPPQLYENFIVIAPYSKGKASFYEEPRSKLLQFMGWSISGDVRIDDTAGGGGDGGDGGGSDEYAYSDRIDRDRKFLFGFSDGATEGIELMCTGKFAAGVFAAYGFTGVLPQLALDRLKGLPIWMFHSVDDGTLCTCRCSTGTVPSQ